MKLKQAKASAERTGSDLDLGKACVGSCQRILAQINTEREVILAESYEAFKAQERLLRLALNEAEAVAWQTRYPQLIFPTLAREKVQAVFAWETRQGAVRRASPVFALAV